MFLRSVKIEIYSLPKYVDKYIKMIIYEFIHNTKSNCDAVKTIKNTNLYLVESYRLVPHYSLFQMMTHIFFPFKNQFM